MIRSCDDRIMDLSTLRAVQRVYGELLKITEGAKNLSGNAPVIDPVPNHSDIASLASTTRETVARVMSELASGGILERQGRKLIVREPGKLRKLATQPGLEGDY